MVLLLRLPFLSLLKRRSKDSLLPLAPASPSSLSRTTCRTLALLPLTLPFASFAFTLSRTPSFHHPLSASPYSPRPPPPPPPFTPPPCVASSFSGIQESPATRTSGSTIQKLTKRGETWSYEVNSLLPVLGDRIDERDSSSRESVVPTVTELILSLADSRSWISRRGAAAAFLFSALAFRLPIPFHAASTSSFSVPDLPKPCVPSFPRLSRFD